MAETTERRRKRSTDPIIALHYQLSTIRAEAELEALVLVDDTGCLVAGAGAWPACEELAAYAPLLVDRSLIRSSQVADRASELRARTQIHEVCVDGMQALLCARGGSGPGVGSSVARAALGCQRILARCA